MTLVWTDRVKETTGTTGSGSYVLSGAVTGYQPFAIIGDGNTCYYAITDNTNWEVGLGTFTAAGSILARSAVAASSAAGAPIDWNPGLKTIWLDASAGAIGALATQAFVAAGYQPLSANLTSWSAVVPASYLTTVAAAAGYQPLSANLTSWSAVVPASYLTIATAAVTYQPVDADLTAIAALATTAHGRALLTTSAAADLRLSEGLPTFVATRTALKALDTTKDTIATLYEAGRDGVFIWTSGNFSSQITADTAEAVYVKATAIASTAGAWVRSFKGQLDAGWAGAVGDGSTDDATAMNALIALLDSLGGGVIALKAATYMVGGLVLRKDVILEGKGPVTSVIKLVNSAASGAHVVDALDPASGTKKWNDLANGGDASNNTAGCRNAGLRHLTIDGNKANNASGGNGFAYYGIGVHLHNVEIKNCHGIGWADEWGSTIGSAAAGQAIQGYVNQVVCHDNDGGQIYYNGPSDSTMSGIDAYMPTNNPTGTPTGYVSPAWHVRIGAKANSTRIYGFDSYGGDPDDEACYGLLVECSNVGVQIVGGETERQIKITGGGLSFFYNFNQYFSSVLSQLPTHGTIVAKAGIILDTNCGVQYFGAMANGNYIVKYSGTSHNRSKFHVDIFTYTGTNHPTAPTQLNDPAGSAIGAKDQFSVIHNITGLSQARLGSNNNLIGVADASDANAGSIGEILESNVLLGAAVALTSTTPANVTFIDLTAGNWMVSGNVVISSASSASTTRAQASISQTSATLDTTTGGALTGAIMAAAVVSSGTAFSLPIGPIRVKVTVGTRVYLVASTTFTVGTEGAYGHIIAQRFQ